MATELKLKVLSFLGMRSHGYWPEVKVLLLLGLRSHGYWP
jgi:hypothetical protein